MMDESTRPNFEAFAARRKVVRLSSESLVRTGFLPECPAFPLLVEPASGDVAPVPWAGTAREAICRWMTEHGALLFRGFAIHSPAEFRDFANAVSGDLLDYQERAAPRQEVDRRIYTSTEYPPEHPIPLHHEMSYSHHWPSRLCFFCAQPPGAGGRTPIAPERTFFPKLDRAIVKRFLEKKVMYVRNYGEGVDLPWQEAFQSDDPRVVEEYCRGCGITLEWKGRDRLRTRQVRQAVARHPDTGETVWFNHAHMFHSSNLMPEVRQALRAQFQEDELPRNAFYGDGSPIEDSILEEIRALYASSSSAFAWRAGDVLMVDNFLVAHGREAFSGARRILVAMAGLYTNPES